MFRKGDRVVLIKDLYGWKNFEYGTIIENKARNGFGHGAEEGENISWAVRWDGFNYGESLTNCHTVAQSAIKSDEVTEDEVYELFGITKEAE